MYFSKKQLKSCNTYKGIIVMGITFVMKTGNAGCNTYKGIIVIEKNKHNLHIKNAATPIKE